MDGNFVQAFLLGFGVATVLYFTFTGLIYISVTPGMEREEAENVVKLTNGKLLSEILEEGHLRLKEMAASGKDLIQQNRLAVSEEGPTLSKQLQTFSERKTHEVHIC